MGVNNMSLTLGKAEKKDFHRINELFVEMLHPFDCISGLDIKYRKTREADT